MVIVMDIKQAFGIIPRSIISLITLFIATKILGKKQVSELSLFDYCIGISIGNFTAEMILVLENQIINGIVAILTFGIAGYLMSLATMKSIKLRRLITGTPTIIMSNGIIHYDSLKQTNIDINDFLEQTRAAGYFDISKISYAIMEANGKISFLLKDNYNIPTKQDLNVKEQHVGLPANIIIDSKLLLDSIATTSKPKEFFIKELKKQGYTSYENILLATYVDNTLKVYTKNANVKPKEVIK